MELSALSSAASGATGVPVAMATTVLRKVLDMASDQSAQLLKTVGQQAGLGNSLDIRA